VPRLEKNEVRGKRAAVGFLRECKKVPSGTGSTKRLSEVGGGVSGTQGGSSAFKVTDWDKGKGGLTGLNPRSSKIDSKGEEGIFKRAPGEAERSERRRRSDKNSMRTREENRKGVGN